MVGIDPEPVTPSLPTNTAATTGTNDDDADVDKVESANALLEELGAAEEEEEEEEEEEVTGAGAGTDAGTDVGTDEDTEGRTDKSSLSIQRIGFSGRE